MYLFFLTEGGWGRGVVTLEGCLGSAGGGGGEMMDFEYEWLADS